MEVEGRGHSIVVPDVDAENRVVVQDVMSERRVVSKVPRPLVPVLFLLIKLFSPNLTSLQFIRNICF